jgi:TnpA family transposase
LNRPSANWAAFFALISYCAISPTSSCTTIQGATNKSEARNGFLKWTFFGGEGIITENSRDEQRKAIKYNHLMANCLIFHNLCSLQCQNAATRS